MTSSAADNRDSWRRERALLEEPVRVTLIFGALLAVAAIRADAAESIPSALEPPPGSILAGRYRANGSQIYVCAADAKGTAWTLRAPDATLVGADGVALIHHFAGPTWQATDGSKVTGAVLVKVSAPDPNAIPWLLLRAAASGAGALAGVRFVQRLDTMGGLAPSGGCKLGSEDRAPYSATYVFWR